jgi:uncharacterized membrane protein YgdD (TMEM256/DUF423 family)
MTEASNIKPYHLIFGSFFMMTGVILGAFGAHALKEVMTPEQLTSFETGVRYQMFHAVALLMIAFKGHHFKLTYEKWIVNLFGIGIMLFSWSIYLLNLQTVLGFEARWLGPITPIGGSLLIIGWFLLMLDGIMILKRKKG